MVSDVSEEVAGTSEWTTVGQRHWQGAAAFPVKGVNGEEPTRRVVFTALRGALQILSHASRKRIWPEESLLPLW